MKNHYTLFRDLFERYNVDIFFNGHNHAYERTHPVSEDQIPAFPGAEGGITLYGLNGGLHTVDYRAVSETNSGGVHGVDPSQWKTIISISDDVTAGLLFNGLNFSTHPAGFDTDNDGMPNDWETARRLDPNTADHNGDNNNDGYTNIEEYLHYRAGLLLKTRNDAGNENGSNSGLCFIGSILNDGGSL